MKMKLLILILLSFTCHAQNYDDSTGWVRPWLNSVTGMIEGMNVNWLDVTSPESPDTIFVGMLIEYPLAPGVTFNSPNDTTLTLRAIGGMDGYAVKERRPLIGQAYHIYDMQRRPIEAVLSRGARIWKIQETGYKFR